MPDCGLCSRSFANEQALEQHERDSPVHTRVHCQLCDSFFSTAEALEQHQKDSLVHNKTFPCQGCNQHFGSNKTLKNHRRFCQAAAGVHLNRVDTPTDQGLNRVVFRNIYPTNLTIDPQSLLLGPFARLLVSETLPQIPPHPQPARAKPLQETREFFTFPSLHPRITHAVSPEIPSPWFNEDTSDNGFDDEYCTHVMGRFTCTNPTCDAQSWASKKVPIEIRGYAGNGYNATVYNQRCKTCDELGTFALNEGSYVERVAYRLKKWAGVEVEVPFFDGNKGLPHETAYCEGCKRGKCHQRDQFAFY